MDSVQVIVKCGAPLARCGVLAPSEGRAPLMGSLRRTLEEDTCPHIGTGTAGRGRSEPAALVEGESRLAGVCGSWE